MRAIGIHEDWTATPPGRTPTQVRERYRKASIGRCFTGKPLTVVQDLRPRVLKTLQPYIDAGTKIIYISIKTDIVQTRNGNWTVRYRELGAYIAQLQVEHNVEIVVIPWHEPEDDFSSAAAFVHYYNKVFDAVKAGTADVQVMPCFLTYHWASGPGGSIRGKTNVPAEWFAGLKMVDGVLLDVYSGRSFPLEQILIEHPGFSRCVQHLPEDVRINLGERGWETPSSTNTVNRSALRAETMRREFEWLGSMDPIARRIDDYTVWSSPGTENAPGLVMDAAAESEIDRFLSLTFPDPAPDPTPAVPDENDEQYRFGFEAGYAAGKEEGRNSAFGEIRDVAEVRITKKETTT